jgi:cold shock CspA family protein/ribosome-associated translation inhibitor RaiA
MPMTLQIAFRNMDPSPTAETLVRRRAGELQQFSDRIGTCRVMLEAANRHRLQGRTYHVRVDMALPGGRVVVDQHPGHDHLHEDLTGAIRDAFDVARRRLQDHMRRLDGAVKHHEPIAIGRIARVLPEQNCGFLTAEDGEEIYVPRGSVAGTGFDALRAGDRVRYVVDPDERERGAQATTVIPLPAGN